MAGPALADVACSKRADFIAFLQQKYAEAPIAIGVSNDGGIVEVLSTENGETWSILVTAPNGLSCLVAGGEGWQDRLPVKRGENL